MKTKMGGKEVAMRTADRLIEVYRALGCVLNNPATFGLGHRAPKPLVDMLTASRQKLMDELIEQRRWREDEDVSLEAELSQDADVRVPCRG